MATSHVQKMDDDDGVFVGSNLKESFWIHPYVTQNLEMIHLDSKNSQERKYKSQSIVLY